MNDSVSGVSREFDTDQESDLRIGRRKVYTTPELQFLGRMNEETLGIGGSNEDTGQGEFTKLGGG